MSAPRRAVVFAYSSVGCVCLRTLLEGGVEVAAVYTHEDDPGEERWFDSVADLARARGLAVLTPDLLDGAEEEHLCALAPDLIFSFYYRSLIPERVLRLAPLGAFNMHGSLLPRYRGRACVNWAVLNGETETGVIQKSCSGYAFVCSQACEWYHSGIAVSADNDTFHFVGVAAQCLREEVFKFRRV